MRGRGLEEEPELQGRQLLELVESCQASERVEILSAFLFSISFLGLAGVGGAGKPLFSSMF